MSLSWVIAQIILASTFQGVCPRAPEGTVKGTGYNLLDSLGHCPYGPGHVIFEHVSYINIKYSFKAEYQTDIKQYWKDNID